MNTLTCGYVPLGGGMVRSWELAVFARWPEAGSSCNLPRSEVAILQLAHQGVPGMSAGGPLFEKSRSIEDLQQMRLLVLLEETVRDKGVMRAAQDLNVDHRTVTVSLETGKPVPADAGRAGEGAAWRAGGRRPESKRQRNDELAGRVERLEGQVEEMGQEHEPGPGCSARARSERVAGGAGAGTAAAGKAGRVSGQSGRGRQRGDEEFQRRRRDINERRTTLAGAHRPASGGSFPSWSRWTRRRTTRRCSGRLGG